MFLPEFIANSKKVTRKDLIMDLVSEVVCNFDQLSQV